MLPAAHDFHVIGLLFKRKQEFCHKQAPIPRGINIQNLPLEAVSAESENVAFTPLDQFLIGIADLVGISNMISAYRVKTAEFNGIFQTAAVFVLICSRVCRVYVFSIRSRQEG